ncbi:MAG: DUF4365 domain-containing protein [Deltaproteobacteria bacterium]|nr:MAG: DUF4365 domain-containing protein [Deltaproteobacteria bacterium]TMQ26843.1 MAG: DUF4365 domain-containing protein [Deltaproteobacteria bacterium]
MKPKNYDDLRHTDYVTPRILVVVFVPEQVADWTTHTEQELTMRYCAYWASLRGLPHRRISARQQSICHERICSMCKASKGSWIASVEERHYEA